MNLESENLAPILVHIGAPKTGSSAIQHICLNNRSLLREYGYYYPRHPIDVNGVSGGHGQLSSLLFSNKIDAAKKWIDKNYEQAAKKNLRLIISAEGLYQNCGGLKKILSAEKAQIFGYFRNPIEAIVSNHNQGIKRSFYTDSLEETCKSILKDPVPKFFSGRLFDDWIAAFGRQNVSIIPFDSSVFARGDVEFDFFIRMGLSEEEIAEFVKPHGKINTSYSPSAMKLKRILNHFLDKKRDKENSIIDELLQKYSADIDEPKPNSEQLLGSDLYGNLHCFFDQDISWLKKNVFNEGADDLWLKERGGRLVGAVKPICGEIYSVEYVYNQALRSNKMINDYIRSCTCEAESLNVIEYELLVQYLPQLRPNREPKREPSDNIFEGYKSLDDFAIRLRNDKYKRADYMRDLALLYECLGKNRNAFQFIEIALEERPEGPLINRIYNRLKNCPDLECRL